MERIAEAAIQGSGAFSACYKVSNKNNGTVSVWKAIDYGWMSWKDQEVLLREVSLLRDIKHRNVVKFVSYMDNKIMCNVYIQMEYCSGGTLMDYIKTRDKSKVMIQENFIWDVLFKLLKALKWLYLKLPNMRMIQWIVTPSDVFLEKGNVKLGGFYLNEKIYCNYDVPGDVPSSSRLLYTSPEVLTGEKHSQKSMVWSLGCVIHELCTMFPPFYGSKPSELISNITNFTRIKISSCFSRELQDAIDVMLETDPAARPTLEELRRHPIVESRFVMLGASRISGDKENIGKKCKKRRDCNKCIHLELELNKIKHKEAALNLKECRLKERELSLARREMKVSQLENFRKAAQVYRNWEGNGESTASGDVSEVVTITSTKLNPFEIKKPNFAKKYVHFTVKSEECTNSTKRRTNHFFDDKAGSTEAKIVPDRQKTKKSEPVEAMITYPTKGDQEKGRNILETHFL
ncbi:UNVERIFIED_CONTAM: hypothetical protein PYX00_001454 [Menopon gallinae]|uniref:non-specific serine/threonine protein kinase n=1 Tax=Menopon gallinae TaxID=328185 RepID=A0AAW2IE98_9NEOP